MILSRSSDVEHARLVQGGDYPVGVDYNHPERELLCSFGAPILFQNEEARFVQRDPLPEVVRQTSGTVQIEQPPARLGQPLVRGVALDSVLGEPLDRVVLEPIGLVLHSERLLAVAG